MNLLASFKSKVLVATLFLTGFALTSSAAPIQLIPTGTDVLADFYINKNGTGPGNGNDSASQLYRLNTYFLGTDIVPTASWKPDTQTNDWSAGGLAGWDYAVVHFGAGAFGGAGGSIGAWYLNGASSFTFPAKSFSSIDLFRTGDGTTVPDGGMTALLLGAGLVSLSLAARRRLSK